MHISRKEKTMTTICFQCGSTEVEEFDAMISIAHEKVYTSGKVTVGLECGFAE